MTPGSADHSTFVIERVLAAPVARVFAAWARPELKRRWFTCDDGWRLEQHQLDFRVGGSESNRVVEPDGTVHAMNARFMDIFPDRRIVYVYEMRLDQAHISVSLVTVRFEAQGSKTLMTFTEQVTFLDGHGDVEERREGTEVGLDRLEPMLAADM
jgi:uncharacterized protein YndB with AHSA1/START domain